MTRAPFAQIKGRIYYLIDVRGFPRIAGELALDGLWVDSDETHLLPATVLVDFVTIPEEVTP